MPPAPAPHAGPHDGWAHPGGAWQCVCMGGEDTCLLRLRLMPAPTMDGRSQVGHGSVCVGGGGGHLPPAPAPHAGTHDGWAQPGGAWLCVCVGGGTRTSCACASCRPPRWMGAARWGMAVCVWGGGVCGGEGGNPVHGCVWGGGQGGTPAVNGHRPTRWQALHVAPSPAWESNFFSRKFYLFVYLLRLCVAFINWPPPSCQLSSPSPSPPSLPPTQVDVIPAAGLDVAQVGRTLFRGGG